MSKLKIFTYPDIVLAQKANPIQRVEKPLRKLADDMLETMYDAPGIGLAANQVGILQRILVLDTDYETPDDENPIRNQDPKIIINPEIVLAEGSIVMEEACLSCPEYVAEVKRFEKIKLQYQDIDGTLKTLMADGLQAVAIQHEIDHLDGKLFIERLSPLKTQMARKKLIKLRESKK